MKTLFTGFDGNPSEKLARFLCRDVGDVLILGADKRKKSGAA